jgi:predicted ATP-grasp superfamily ATP-dependent carboligase
VIGGDYQGLAIARSLGRQGIPVCVVDDEVSIARVSRFSDHTVRVDSLREEQDTLDALKLAARRHDLDGWVLFPTRDETVAALSRNREALSATFRVPTPSWETIRGAWDKRETYRIAAEVSVPTPRTWLMGGEDELDAVEMRGPLVIKPAIKEHFFYATRAKAWRADTPDELRAAFRRAAALIGPREVIVQEMIPGDGTTQFSYCALFTQGRAVAAMTVRRRRQHPSDFGRASTFVETVDLPAIEAPSIRFLKAIGYYGLVELEYKRDPRDGEYKLLDVNARTWGYHGLGPAAGVDFPALLYRDQMGETLPTVCARPGVRWIRLATDVPNAVRDMASGTLRPSTYLRSLRGVDVEAVFSMSDPLPGAFELALLPYLFVRRGL